MGSIDADAEGDLAAPARRNLLHRPADVRVFGRGGHATLDGPVGKTDLVRQLHRGREGLAAVAGEGDFGVVSARAVGDEGGAPGDWILEDGVDRRFVPLIAVGQARRSGRRPSASCCPRRCSRPLPSIDGSRSRSVAWRTRRLTRPRGPRRVQAGPSCSSFQTVAECRSCSRNHRREGWCVQFSANHFFNHDPRAHRGIGAARTSTHAVDGEGSRRPHGISRATRSSGHVRRGEPARLPAVARRERG